MSIAVDHAVDALQGEPGMARLAAAVSIIEGVSMFEKVTAAENALAEACLVIVALSRRVRELEGKRNG